MIGPTVSPSFIITKWLAWFLMSVECIIRYTLIFLLKKSAMQMREVSIRIANFIFLMVPECKTRLSTLKKLPNICFLYTDVIWRSEQSNCYEERRRRIIFAPIFLFLNYYFCQQIRVSLMRNIMYMLLYNKKKTFELIFCKREQLTPFVIWNLKERNQCF